MEKPLLLRHFKVRHDQNLKWDAICPILFGGNKCLVTIEKLTTTTHFHIQGYTQHSEEYFKKLVQQHVHQGHWLSKEGKKPVKHPKDHDKVNELGFQYMLKEPWENVVYSQEFEQTELDDLKKQAVEYMDKCKKSLKRKLETVLDDCDPKEFHRRCARAVGSYYRDDLEKNVPPNANWRVINFLYTNPKFEKYAERLLFKDAPF